MRPGIPLFRGTRAAPLAVLLPLAATLQSALAGAEGPRGDQHEIERLLDLNAPELIGAPVDIKDGRIHLSLAEKGLFAKCFKYTVIDRGPKYTFGILTQQAQITHAGVRKRLLEELAGKLTFAAIDHGRAESRFELADDFKIAFKIRIGVLDPKAQLTWEVNDQGSQSIRSDFFRTIEVRGRKRQTALPKERKLLARPFTWFDLKSKGVPVEIRFHKRVLSIALDGKETVRLEGIEEPLGGRVAFGFSNLNFVLSDLQIEGKLREEWIRESLRKLEKEGKLRTARPQEVARGEKRTPAGEKGEHGGGKGAPGAAEGAEEQKPRPEDPEAEIDL